MAGVAMPEIQASWDGTMLATFCDDGECVMALLHSRCVVYTDGSWVRAVYDVTDPMRNWSEAGDEGGEAMLARFQGYAALAPVAH